MYISPESSLIIIAIAMCSILVLFTLASMLIYRCCKDIEIQQIPATVYQLSLFPPDHVRVMGSVLCPPKKNKPLGGSSWVGNELENPFDVNLTKKDRTLLRETFQRLDEPKEVIGKIFVEIVNDIEPNLKKVFGVDRAPRAAMQKMPKFGGHVARITDFFDQITSMLGFTENLTGAWQLVRKTGRSHVRQSFLEQNLNQLEKNYFEIVLNVFNERLVPYLTGDKEDGTEKKKVRFATNYPPQQVAEVWKRLFSILIVQMTDAFELERSKQRNAQYQKTLAPHQQHENNDIRERKIQERASKIENASVAEPKQQEEMYEDPF